MVLVARGACTPPLLSTAPHRHCRPRRKMRVSREQHQSCASSASSPTLQRAPQVFPIDRVAAASRTGRVVPPRTGRASGDGGGVCRMQAAKETMMPWLRRLRRAARSARGGHRTDRRCSREAGSCRHPLAVPVVTAAACRTQAVKEATTHGARARRQVLW